MEKDVPVSDTLDAERITTVCANRTHRGYLDGDGHVRPICEFCETINPDFIGATIVNLTEFRPCEVMVVDA